MSLEIKTTSPNLNFENIFSAISQNGLSKEPSWLIEFRKKSLANFSTLGFPTMENEEWKYTNISAISKTEYKLPETFPHNLSVAKIKEYLISNSYYLVFLNGKFISELSSFPQESGVKIFTISEGLKNNPDLVSTYLTKLIETEKNSLVSLNSALFNDGIFIELAENTKLLKPIEIIYLTQNEDCIPRIISPRSCVVVGKNAQLDIVEQHVSLNSNNNFTNVVTEIFVEENAKCEYIKIQNEASEGFHIGNVAVSQKTSSDFFSFAFTLGCKISRNQIKFSLLGEKSNSNMNGLYISTNNQLHDNHTLIEHIEPECMSREFFKGIVYDEAKAVFNGKVYVHSIAQKTDSKQTNKNLLLSENATVDTKPQLEIFADDVKCTHGGTVGGIDANSLFYLKSRGVSQKSAEALFALGFASEVTETIENATIRKYVDNLVVKRLEKAHGGILLPYIVHTN